MRNTETGWMTSKWVRTAEFKRGGGPRSEVHGQIDVLNSDVATVMKGLETLSKFAEKGMVT
jgi:hypothetical protein